MSNYDALFEPIKLPNGVTLPNRLAIAPMTTWSGNDNGTVSDQELAYYKRRSALAGLFISGCIAVSPTGLAFDHQFIAYDDAVLPRLKKLAQAMKASGSKAIVQIQHGGSEANPNLVIYNQLVGPSAVPSFSNPDIVPKALSEEEIETIIKEFGFAVRRVIRAGFDGVEIHGANHFLIQQFVSAHFNRRTDAWGGTLEKRLRFPLEILKEIHSIVKREAKNPFIVGYRFSPEEINRFEGYTIKNVFQLVDKLLDQGVDYLHVSQTDITSLPHDSEKGSPTMVHRLAEHIKHRVPLIAVGGIRYPQEAVRGLEDGADLIALGQEAIIEPDWAQKVREQRENEIKTVVSSVAQKELVIPDRLWKIVLQPNEWLPPKKQ